FFQAEDGIRDLIVTGVQTCALPISMATAAPAKTSAFMKALKPSPALAAIVGSEPLPRTAVTKALWDYIKAHNLQNPANKRNILRSEERRVGKEFRAPGSSELTEEIS